MDYSLLVKEFVERVKSNPVYQKELRVTGECPISVFHTEDKSAAIHWCEAQVLTYYNVDGQDEFVIYSANGQYDGAIGTITPDDLEEHALDDVTVVSIDRNLGRELVRRMRDQWPDLFPESD